MTLEEVLRKPPIKRKFGLTKAGIEAIAKQVGNIVKRRRCGCEDEAP